MEISNLEQRHRLLCNNTRRLREIRNNALCALGEIKPFKFCIGISVTIHLFKDCLLVYVEYKQGYLSAAKDEPLNKTYAVYSKDIGKTFNVYTDQFEPKEGWHHAVRYEPIDADFPTKEW